MFRMRNHDPPSQLKYVPEEKETYKNRDVFAWTHSELADLDPAVVMHHLAIESGRCPVKQVMRRMHPDFAAKLEIGVDKLVKADFIKEVQYPIWLENIMLVEKKNEQIQVCIDFRDLNKACP